MLSSVFPPPSHAPASAHANPRHRKLRIARLYASPRARAGLRYRPPVPRRARALPVLLLALLSACRRDAGTTTPVQASEPARVPPSGRAAADEPVAARSGAGLDTDAQQRRLRGLELMDAGRFDLARAEFAAILEVAPGNLSAQALLAASTQALLAAREDAARGFADVSPTVLAAPPWQYTLRREVQVPPGPPPQLVKVVTRANKVTDEAAWFREHDLRLPEYEVPSPVRGLPGDLPPHIPPTFGAHPLVQAIGHRDHTVLFYGPDYRGGRQIAVQGASGELLAFLDFAAYGLAPGNAPEELQRVEQRAIWAEARDGVLYVAHAHNIEARSSNGMTGYITAVELATGELLWRSAPRVANAANFVIDGGHIITGYGLAGELDHVFVLARRDGKTAAKARVNSAPEYLFVRGRRLFVRTHDTDHEFDLR